MQSGPPSSPTVNLVRRGVPAGRLDEALRDGHIGVASVTERIRAAGVNISIDGAEGRRTTAVVVIPRPPGVQAVAWKA
jgi:hypothetical protein